MPLPSASRLVPQNRLSAAPRVECYYLGWLGDQSALIHLKKELLSEAKGAGNRPAEKSLIEEIRNISKAAGTIELYDLFLVDFREARKARPDDWALKEACESEPQLEPYKPAGPNAPKIVDKRDRLVFPSSEQMSSPPPPMLDRVPVSERRGPGGGYLIPRRG